MDVKTSSPLSWAALAVICSVPAAASEIVFTSDLPGDPAQATVADAPRSDLAVAPAQFISPTAGQPVVKDRFVRPTGAATRFHKPSRTALRLRPTGQRPSAGSNRAKQRSMQAVRKSKTVRLAVRPKGQGPSTRAGRTPHAGPSQGQRQRSQATRGVTAQGPHGPASSVVPMPAPNREIRQARSEADPAAPHPMPLPPRPGRIQPANIQPSDIDALVEAPMITADATALIEAHKLAATASTAKEFGKIARLCADALQETESDESRQFGKELAAWALNRRGELRTNLGEPELALADFETATALDETAWRPVHNRSVTHAQAGRFADAFDDVNRVIELHPTFAKAYSNRATLYVEAGESELALADYQKALEHDSDLIAAHVGRGRVCHMLGRLDDALKHLDEAVKISGNSAQVVCSRADLRADLGHYEQALEDYARAVEIDPAFAHAYRNGAWLLATCPDERYRDVENAIQGAEQAIENGYGQRHAALDTLAAAWANAGEFEKAARLAREAIAEAPDEVVGAYQDRLELYESGRPYRSTPLRSDP